MTIFLPPKLNTYRLNACTFGISYHSWQPIECELENKSTSSTRKKKIRLGVLSSGHLCGSINGYLLLGTGFRGSLVPWLGKVRRR